MEKIPEKLTQFVRRRLNSWQKGLEIVLEQDPNLDHKKPVSIFEATTDVLHLEETLRFLPNSNTSDRMIHMFSRMTSYFESGVLLYKHSTEVSQQEIWSPGAVFFKGQYYPLAPEHLQLRLQLPALNFLELRKTSPYAILQQLHLTEISDSADASAFAFKADMDFLFLVFSELPEPWLRTHIENIFNILKETISRS